MIDTSKFDELIATCDNAICLKTLLTFKNKLATHGKILVAYSGGSDSDIMVDLISVVPHSCEVAYVFYDTGIEYEATRRHIKDIEVLYGIHIDIERAVTPVPLGIKKYGVPFMSKKMSETIARLQSHNFDWSDGSLDELLVKYPKCKAALRWWTNHMNITERIGNLKRKQRKW